MYTDCGIPHCSELLSEFSSTLSEHVETPLTSTKTQPTSTRTAVSSTRILFDVLAQFLHRDDQVGVEALPIFFDAFLHENRYITHGGLECTH